MATAPFNPNENVPADDDIVSQFPAAERAFRDIMEDWINTEHDTSGHHKFQVISTATRDGISDWVVGSQIYNTTTEQIEILTSTGPNVWSAAVPSVISTGTWTPVLNFGGATTGITYAIQSGNYTKVGPLVNVAGHIALSSNGTAQGVATITGLPFASLNFGSFFPISTLLGHSDLALEPEDDVTRTGIVTLKQDGTSTLHLFINEVTSTTDDLFEMEEFHFEDGTDLTFNMTYRTS